MRVFLGRIAGSLALLASSLLLTFIALEFVVFAFILVPDDVLPNVSINGVVRYEPGRQATFRHPDGTATSVSINADGWNTSKPAYDRKRNFGVKRVAVVGDSYVHAAFVDTADGFPEVLERTLNRSGRVAEVYRFGMDGAPLSQYLNVVRREVVTYRPDVVVVTLIHNDFDESTRFLGTRYNSSFMKIGVDAAGQPREIAAQDFAPGFADVLRASRTFRYLYYETNAYLRLKGFVSKYVWGEAEVIAPELVSSAVDIRALRDDRAYAPATRYVMGALRALADRERFKLLFVMDGVREAVYAGRPASDYEVGTLNRLAADTAAALGVPFLDLQDAFAGDFADNHARFEFAYDWHWNKHANALVGAAIAAKLTSEPELLAPARRLSALAR